MLKNGVLVLILNLVRKFYKKCVKKNVNVAARLLISKKAHLILPTHKLLDAASETEKGKSKIGSTLKGIGPTYMDKTGRNGLQNGTAAVCAHRYHELLQQPLRRADRAQQPAAGQGRRRGFRRRTHRGQYDGRPRRLYRRGD